jgi:PDZ domain
MKTIRHLPIITAILSLPAFAFSEEPLEKTPRTSTSSSNSSVSVSNADGTAVISVDKDGERRVKVLKLGGDGGKPTISFTNADVRSIGPKTWLGVALNEVSEQVANQLPIDPGTGLVVEHVSQDSPADKAGLQKHDVLVRLDDQVLIAPKQFQTLIANHKPGDEVTIIYYRKGQQSTAKAKLDEGKTHAVGDANITIDLNGAKMDIDRIIRDAHDTAASVILNKKTVFVGPDGNPVTIDSDEIRRKTLELLEKSGLKEEVLDQVKRAISEAQAQIRKATDEAKAAADRAAQQLHESLKEKPSTPLRRQAN